MARYHHTFAVSRSSTAPDEEPEPALLQLRLLDGAWQLRLLRTPLQQPSVEVLASSSKCRQTVGFVPSPVKPVVSDCPDQS